MDHESTISADKDALSADTSPVSSKLRPGHILKPGDGAELNVVTPENGVSEPNLAPSGASSKAPTLVAPPSIPGYRIDSILGQGATAIVWKAEQESLSRYVAIKVLKKIFSDSPDDVRDFINEARAVAQLNSANIIRIFDVGRNENTYYFVMEYVAGETLGAVLRREDSIPPKRALSIALQIASGLEKAWESGKIIHRDIKPENIMIEPDGGVKIADLGLASIVTQQDPGATQAADDMPGTLCGTPNYMSPEQVQRQTGLDSRTDMYSLGALLYHMITGKLPFGELPLEEVLEQQVSGQLPNPRSLKPSLGLGSSQLITRLMMKNPADRYSSWNETVKEIKKVASGKIVVGPKALRGTSTIAPMGDGSTGGVSSATKLQPERRAPRIGKKKKAVVVRRSKPARASADTTDSAAPAATIATETGTAPETAVPSGNRNAPVGDAPKAPSWLPKALMFLTLFVAFVSIRHSLMKLPPDVEIAPMPQAVSTPKPPPASTPDSVTPPRTASVPSSRAPSTVKPIVPSPSRPAPAPKRPPEDEAHLNSIKTQVSRLLLSRNPKDALDLIAREADRSGSAELGSLQRLVRHAMNPADAVASVLRDNLGKDLTMQINGRDVTLRVQSIVSGRVMGDLVSDTGATRATSFDVAALDPADQATILKSEVSPEMAVLRYTLLMKSGDIMEAHEEAKGCGALADVFTENTSKKIRMLIE